MIQRRTLTTAFAAVRIHCAGSPTQPVWMHAYRRHGDSSQSQPIALPLMTPESPLWDPALYCSRGSSEPDMYMCPQLVALALIAGGLQLAAKSDYILIIDCGSSGTRMCAQHRCSAWTPLGQQLPWSLVVCLALSQSAA